MTSDSKRKRGRPLAILKNTLTKDLRNIARIAGIYGANSIEEIGKDGQERISPYRNGSVTRLTPSEYIWYAGRQKLASRKNLIWKTGEGRQAARYEGPSVTERGHGG